MPSAITLRDFITARVPLDTLELEIMQWLLGKILAKLNSN